MFIPVHEYSIDKFCVRMPLEFALMNINRIARGLDWYTGYQHKFMSINSIRRYSSTWCRREKSWSRHQNCKRRRELLLSV